MNKQQFNKLSPERQKDEMISFCLKNGVKIYLTAISGTKARIDVDDNGLVTAGKIIFNTSKKRKKTEPDWNKAIVKGYEYYYNKLNKQENE